MNKQSANRDAVSGIPLAQSVCGIATVLQKSRCIRSSSHYSGTFK